jgi:hypothetical protein
VTLRSENDAHAVAFCLHIGMEEVKAGSRVSAVGVVVNAGTVVSDQADPVKGIFLQAAGNRCGG